MVARDHGTGSGSLERACSAGIEIRQSRPIGVEFDGIRSLACRLDLAGTVDWPSSTTAQIPDGTVDMRRWSVAQPEWMGSLHGIPRAMIAAKRVRREALSWFVRAIRGDGLRAELAVALATGAPTVAAVLALARLHSAIQGWEFGRRAIRRLRNDAVGAICLLFDARFFVTTYPTRIQLVRCRKMLAQCPSDDDWTTRKDRADLLVKEIDRLLDHARLRERIGEYAASRCRLAECRTKLRVAVYTVIADGYDSLKVPHRLNPDWDYVLFVDQPAVDTGVWQVRPISYWDCDAARTTRYVKLHPHLLLPDYDVAVYIDASVVVLDEFADWVTAFLASGKPVAARPHPRRQDVYQEAEACRGRDEEATILSQVARYRAEGFSHDDLSENNVLMFDLRNPETALFLSRWWRELACHSARDQLSMNYALSRCGLDYFRLPQRRQDANAPERLSVVGHDGGVGVLAGLPEFLDARAVDPFAGPSFAESAKKRIARRRSDRVDIVVCVGEPQPIATRCIRSLLAARSGPHQRLIVVPAGPVDAHCAALAGVVDAAPGVELVREGPREGYANAAALGLSVSTADFVVVLRGDTVVSPGWVEKLADAAASTPAVGVVGPLSNTAGHQSIRAGSAESETPEATVLRMNRCCEAWTPAHYLPSVPSLHNFCFGIRRRVVDLIGYPDEAFFRRGDREADGFSARVVDAGLELLVATRTFVGRDASAVTPRPEPPPQAASKPDAQRVRLARASLAMQKNPSLVALRMRARQTDKTVIEDATGAVAKRKAKSGYRRARGRSKVGFLYDTSHRASARP